MRSRNAIALGWPCSSPPRARGGFERKAHLDVGGGELVAGEPFALCQLAFPIRHVLLELRIDDVVSAWLRDLAHHRPEQRRRRFGISVNSSFSSSGGIAEPSA